MTGVVEKMNRFHNQVKLWIVQPYKIMVTNTKEDWAPKNSKIWEVWKSQYRDENDDSKIMGLIIFKCILRKKLPR